MLEYLKKNNLVQAADSATGQTVAAVLQRELSTLLELKAVGDVRGIRLAAGRGVRCR